MHSIQLVRFVSIFSQYIILVESLQLNGPLFWIFSFTEYLANMHGMYVKISN